MRLNQLKILSCNLVLIVFHLFERSFVVAHQLINMLILAFLNLVDLDFHPKIKLSFKFLKLMLIRVN